MNPRCYTCGVPGYGELLAVCSHCNVNYSHVYCMKIVIMSVPEKWICEECQLSDRKDKRVKPKPDSSLSASFAGNMRRPTRPGTVFLSPREVVSLRSGSLRQPEDKLNFVPTPQRKEPLEPRKVPFGPGSSSVKRSCFANLHSRLFKVKSGPKTLEDPYKMVSSSIETTVHGSKGATGDGTSIATFLRSKSCISRFDTTVAAVVRPHQPSLKQHKLKEQHLNEEHPPVKKAGNSHESCNKENVQASPSPDAHINPGPSSSKFFVPVGKHIELYRSLPNQPASFATWRGCFEFSNSAMSASCDAINGYPPSKVALKALEFSKQMPGVLQCEFLPRQSLWPDLFQDESPDHLDIGLYFFPGDHRSEETYVSLVEHLLDQDMAIRSFIFGTELFVFTSKILHQESQKINHNHYLWGHFRSLKDNGQSFIHPASESKYRDEDQEVEADNSVDMAVDMIGEKPVGRINTPFHKSTSEHQFHATVGSKIELSELDVSPIPSGSEAPLAMVPTGSKQGKIMPEEQEEGGVRNATAAAPRQQAIAEIKIEKSDSDELPPPPGFPVPLCRKKLEKVSGLRRGLEQTKADPDEPESRTINITAVAVGQQPTVEVKTEALDFDDLPPPPGFAAPLDSKILGSGMGKKFDYLLGQPGFAASLNYKTFGSGRGKVSGLDPGLEQTKTSPEEKESRTIKTEALDFDYLKPPPGFESPTENKKLGSGSRTVPKQRYKSLKEIM